jgi:hypothetical protein
LLKPWGNTQASQQIYFQIMDDAITGCDTVLCCYSLGKSVKGWITFICTTWTGWQAIQHVHVIMLYMHALQVIMSETRYSNLSIKRVYIPSYFFAFIRNSIAVHQLYDGWRTLLWDCNYCVRKFVSFLAEGRWSLAKYIV